MAELAVGVRDLKTRLGSYLRQVRAGRTLTVTDRGRPVAMIAPVDMTGQSTEARLARLRAEGTVTGTGRPLPRAVGQIASRRPLFSETIAEEREDRL